MLKGNYSKKFNILISNAADLVVIDSMMTVFDGQQSQHADDHVQSRFKINTKSELAAGYLLYASFLACFHKTKFILLYLHHQLSMQCFIMYVDELNHSVCLHPVSVHSRWRSCKQFIISNASVDAMTLIIGYCHSRHSLRDAILSTKKSISKSGLLTRSSYFHSVYKIVDYSCFEMGLFRFLHYHSN